MTDMSPEAARKLVDPADAGAPTENPDDGVIRIKFDGDLRPEILSIEPNDFDVEWVEGGDGMYVVDWVLVLRPRVEDMGSGFQSGVCTCEVQYQTLEVFADNIGEATTYCGECGKAAE